MRTVFTAVLFSDMQKRENYNMKKEIKLWENGAPYYKPEYGQKEPYIVEYTLDNGKKDNPCVIVIPGGGYGCVCDDHEGRKICEMLNENGFSAFILEYRITPYCHPVMEEDAKRAIRLVRFNAEKFGIAPDKIGVIGFSAGGHLCCMAGLRYDYGRNDGDEIDSVSSRPDAVAPSYAVASFNKEITHMGTRENCLGPDGDEELAYALSSENIVPDDAPPFFIWHTAQDGGVDPENSLRLASALIRKNIPCELHIFPYGPHGIGLGEDTPLACEWPSLYVKWLRHHFGC